MEFGLAIHSRRSGCGSYAGEWYGLLRFVASDALYVALLEERQRELKAQHLQRRDAFQLHIRATRGWHTWQGSDNFEGPTDEVMIQLCKFGNMAT